MARKSQGRGPCFLPQDLFPPQVPAVSSRSGRFLRRSLLDPAYDRADLHGLSLLDEDFQNAVSRR